MSRRRPLLLPGLPERGRSAGARLRPRPGLKKIQKKRRRGNCGAEVRGQEETGPFVVFICDNKTQLFLGILSYLLMCMFLHEVWFVKDGRLLQQLFLTVDLFLLSNFLFFMCICVFFWFIYRLVYILFCIYSYLFLAY